MKKLGISGIFLETTFGCSGISSSFADHDVGRHIHDTGLHVPTIAALARAGIDTREKWDQLALLCKHNRRAMFATARAFELGLPSAANLATYILQTTQDETESRTALDDYRLTTTGDGFQGGKYNHNIPQTVPKPDVDSILKELAEHFKHEGAYSTEKMALNFRGGAAESAVDELLARAYGRVQRGTKRLVKPIRRKLARAAEQVTGRAAPYLNRATVGWKIFKAKTNAARQAARAAQHRLTPAIDRLKRWSRKAIAQISGPSN